MRCLNDVYFCLRLAIHHAVVGLCLVDTRLLFSQRLINVGILLKIVNISFSLPPLAVAGKRRVTLSSRAVVAMIDAYELSLLLRTRSCFVLRDSNDSCCFCFVLFCLRTFAVFALLDNERRSIDCERALVRVGASISAGSLQSTTTTKLQQWCLAAMRRIVEQQRRAAADDEQLIASFQSSQRTLDCKSLMIRCLARNVNK